MCPKPKLTLWPDLRGLGLGPASKWPTDSWMQFCLEVQESWVYKTKMMQHGAPVSPWLHIGTTWGARKLRRVGASPVDCVLICLRWTLHGTLFHASHVSLRSMQDWVPWSSAVVLKFICIIITLLKHRLRGPVSREFDPVCEFVFLTNFWVTLMCWSGSILWEPWMPWIEILRQIF